jgi:Domain of unknown function (DUF929)
MAVQSDASLAPSGRGSTSRPLPIVLLTLAVILIVLAIVIVLVVFKLTGTSPVTVVPDLAPVSSTLVKDLNTLPSRTFDSVGNPTAPLLSAPAVIRGGPALTVHGRPAVVWVGTLYNPASAAQRWALVIALARFGKFDKLYATSSSTAEVFPGTVTFSLYGSVYKSSEVSLAAVEEYGNESSNYAPAGFERLQTPNTTEAAAMKSYDRSPWAEQGIFPFVDVANRIVVSGSDFSPGLLSGLTMQQIATDLLDPSLPVTQAVLGEANQITAAICAARGGAPRGVCSTSAVSQATADLGLKG